MKELPAQTDFIVVGAGLAGLRAAIELSAAGRVLVLTKTEVGNLSTPDPKADASPAAKVTTPPAPKPWVLLDTATASEWNFQGCAISGPSRGKCLDRVPALKDYWFDWRNYHPDTTIYKR